MTDPSLDAMDGPTALVPAMAAAAALAELGREPILPMVLRAMREMLRMDVAYISEFDDRRIVVREIDGAATSFRLAQGRSMPLQHTYCQRMLDGRLPNLIPDVRGDERTASMPITLGADVGAFVTVPIVLEDGRLYGTLCAASHGTRDLLGYAELQLLNLLARVVADQLQ